MKIVILCGGFGTKFGSAGGDLPNKQYFLNLPVMVDNVRLEGGSGKPPVFRERPPEMDWTITLAETGHDSQPGYQVKPAPFEPSYGSRLDSARLPNTLEPTVRTVRRSWRRRAAVRPTP